jgi:hypothetical protein
MAIVATLLDKAKQAKSLTSDSALAAALGTNRQVVSQWRNGDSYPSEDNIAALALMGGDDPTQWLVAIKAVRSEGSAGKYWAALAKRLAATAMTLALGVSFALPARAQDAVAAFKAPSDYTLCEIAYGPHGSGCEIAYGPHGSGRAGFGCGSSLACPVAPLAKRNSQHERQLQHRPAAAVLGRWATAPSGERIPERRLRGLLWRADATDLRDAARNRNLARKARQQSIVKVVVVELAAWRERHFGSMAG